MKFCNYLATLLLFTLAVSCSPTPEETSAGAASETAVVEPELYLFDEWKSKAPDTSVQIGYDKLFHGSRSFRAFSLNRIIDSIPAIRSLDSSRYKLVFVCTDGYEPSMPLADLYRFAGWVSAQGKEELGAWPDSLRERVPPYYVTWSVETAEDHQLPYPYGAIGFKVIPNEDLYSQAFPAALAGDAEAAEGFRLFRENCISCHSMNKQGGNVGPELNFPKNITEYRDRETLYQFIRNPQAFRYNSKMAAPQLSDAELDQVYYYIQTMKGYKIKG